MAHNLLTDESGLLTFPLYFGTSTCFADSILEHGLGGQRNAEVFNIDLLREIGTRLSQIRELVGRHTWWTEYQYIVSEMCNQAMTGQLGWSGHPLDVKYERTYVSASLKTALGYAEGFGSELVNMLHGAYNELLRRNEFVARH